jgi:hypothetical protein
VAPSTVLTTGSIDIDQWLNRTGLYQNQPDEYLNITLDRDSAINLEGTIISKDGDVGGYAGLFARSINLGSTALIDASGAFGGGTILVGGSWQNSQPWLSLASLVSAQPGSELKANALTKGHGGKVVVNSKNSTEFSGFIDIRGGSDSGDGGLAEVSSSGGLAYQGITDATATKGETGSLLLDPTSYFIGTSPDGTASTTDHSILSTNQLNINLDTANVTLQATQDITLGEDFTFDGSTGDADRTLTFDSPLIVLQGSIGVAAGQTEKLNLQIGVSATQNLALAGAARSIATNGGSITILEEGKIFPLIAERVQYR